MLVLFAKRRWDTGGILLSNTKNKPLTRKIHSWMDLEGIVLSEESHLLYGSTYITFSRQTTPQRKTDQWLPGVRDGVCVWRKRVGVIVKGQHEGESCADGVMIVVWLNMP